MDDSNAIVNEFYKWCEIPLKILNSKHLLGFEGIVEFELPKLKAWNRKLLPNIYTSFRHTFWDLLRHTQWELWVNIFQFTLFALTLNEKKNVKRTVGIVKRKCNIFTLFLIILVRMDFFFNFDFYAEQILILFLTCKKIRNFF